MAQLVLGAVGGIIGGPVGFMIGSMIGSLLDPQKQEGPRLTNLHLQGSQYGQMIPWGYGTFRIAGNVIWQTDLQEHKHTSGGKGGPQVTTYTYTTSFAVQVCEGPIEAIRRVWADGLVIYDARAGAPPLDPIPMTVYTGTTVQMPDPTMESVLGVGNVPAHRGYVLAVFTDWDVGTFGNRIPSLEFEVQVVGIPNAALHLVVTNYTKPQAYVNPLITSWDLNVGTVRVSERGTRSSQIIPPVNVAAVYTYDATPSGALAGLGAGTVGPGDTTPQPMTFNGAPFDAIGNVINGTLSRPLWYESIGAVTGTGTNPTVATDDLVAFAGDSNWYGADVLAAWGIPIGRYAREFALSADQHKFMVFTSPTAITNMDTWHLIKDGEVTATGTITPSLSVPSFGISSGVVGSPCNAMEDNAKFIWVFSPNAAGAGVMRVYSIDASGNLTLNTVCGSAQLNPAEGGGSGAAVRVVAEGYCGVVHDNGDIGIFSRYPVGATVQPPLSTIVSDLSVRAGLTTGQIDVTQLVDLVDGYVIDRQSAARDLVSPLQMAFFFDAVESSGVIKWVKRGSKPVLTVPDNDLAAQARGGTQPPALALVKRVQEVDLPARVNVSYFNSGADYQTGSQPATRQVTSSQMQTTAQLAIVMSDTKAKSVAEINLFNAWLEREQLTFWLPRKYWYLEPCDVLSLRGYQIRIVRKSDGANGVIQFEGVVTSSSIWIQGPTAASSAGYTPTVPPVLQLTSALLLDIPLVVDADLANGFYAAMAGAASGTWGGASLYKSSDAGASYASVGTGSVACVIGTASSVLSDFPGAPNMFDEANRVTVVVGAGGGTLASASELAVLNGANLALLGDEIIQFKVATPVSGSTWTLSGLLRGRRGSEWAMVKHAIGERFVLLTNLIDVPGAASELGVSRLYKAVTRNDTLANTVPQTFTNNGVCVQPYAPVLVAGSTQVSPFDGSVQINWVRRTRVGGAWVNFSGVPLSETAEGYVVQIWDSTWTKVARIIETTTPTVTYTAAMQTTDFGALQQHIYVTVGQKGGYRLGTQARATIAGNGGSDSAPIAPIPPYNGSPPITKGCTLPVTSDTWTWGVVPSIVYNAAAGPNATWVISFTTPSSLTSAIGNVSLSYFNSLPTNRDATLSLSPCGPALTPASVQHGNIIAITFYTGPGNPYPAIYPTLLPSTTYYVSINSSANSGMVATLTPIIS